MMSETLVHRVTIQQLRTLLRTYRMYRIGVTMPRASAVAVPSSQPISSTPIQRDLYMIPPAPQSFLTELISGPTMPIMASKSSKSQKYSERKLLGYSMEQMFTVVSGVDKYNEFVPWCTKSSLQLKKGSHFQCQMEIGFSPFKESYTSTVSIVKPYLVKSVCTDGRLFNHLISVWRFGPGIPSHADESCTVDFAISFEFRSKLHAHISNVFFDQVAKSMVNAFTNRAEKLYGPQSAHVEEYINKSKAGHHS